MTTAPQKVYAAVPLAFLENFGIADEYADQTIFAVTHINNDEIAVVLIDEEKTHCTILHGPLNPETYTIDKDKRQTTYLGNGSVAFLDVKPYPDGLIFLIKVETSYMLYVWVNDGNDINISVETSVFCVNQNQGSEKYSIAIGYKNSLNVIAGPESEQSLLQCEFDTQVLSVAYYYPNVFVVCENSINIIDIEKKDDYKSRAMNFNENSEPCCYVGSRSWFVLCHDGKAEKIDSASLSQEKIINFKENVTNTTKFSTTFMSTKGEDSIVIYDFVNNNYFETTIKDVTAATLYQMHEYISTTSDVYILQRVSDSFNYAKLTKFSESIKTLPKFCNEKAIHLAFFEFLWNYCEDGKYPYRSNITNYMINEYPAYLKDILFVYEIFHFYYQDEADPDQCYEYASPYMKNAVTDSSQASIESVIELMNSYLERKMTKESNEYKKDFTTAILEAYIYLNKVDEIKKYLNKNNEIDQTTILMFMDSITNTSTKVIVYSIIDQAEAALEALKQINKPDKEILEIVVRIMQNRADDWDFILLGMDLPFIKADPILGMELLTSPKIDISKALKYVEENQPELTPLFYLSAIHNPNIINRRQILQDLTEQISKALINLKEDDFAVDSLKFLKCVIRNGKKAKKEDAEKELTGYLQLMIKDFSKEIDMDTLLNFVSQFNRSLKVSIYLAAEKYDQAMDIIWKDNNNDIEKAAKECRNCAAPSEAFKLLIKKMKESPDLKKEKSFLPELTKLVTNNIDIIDLSDALEQVFSDTEESSESVFNVVEEIYRTLLASRRDAEIEQSYSKSELFEAKYRNMKLKSECVKISTDDVCHKCGQPLGDSYFTRAVDGHLYHNNCLPGQ